MIRYYREQTMSSSQFEESDDYFLDFDGTTFDLEFGHWIKFDVKRVEASQQRPHGLKYSLTLHRNDGTRLIGFDNAHSMKVTRLGFHTKPAEYDHWHRTEFDAGQIYQFQGIPKLLEDFFAAVDTVLKNEK